MNGNSFNGLAEYEKLPMSKFILMLNVHNETVYERNAAMNK